MLLSLDVADALNVQAGDDIAYSPL
jgi:hypothetical protein